MKKIDLLEINIESVKWQDVQKQLWNSYTKEPLSKTGFIPEYSGNVIVIQEGEQDKKDFIVSIPFKMEANFDNDFEPKIILECDLATIPQKSRSENYVSDEGFLQKFLIEENIEKSNILEKLRKFLEKETEYGVLPSPYPEINHDKSRGEFVSLSSKIENLTITQKDNEHINEMFNNHEFKDLIMTNFKIGKITYVSDEEFKNESSDFFKQNDLNSNNFKDEENKKIKLTGVATLKSICDPKLNFSIEWESYGLFDTKFERISTLGVPLVSESGFQYLKNNGGDLLENRNDDSTFIHLLKGVDNVFKSVKGNLSHFKEQYHEKYFSMSDDEKNFNNKIIKLYENTPEMNDMTPRRSWVFGAKTRKHDQYWERAISFDDFIKTHLHVEYNKRGFIEGNKMITITEEIAPENTNKNFLNINELKNKLTGF